MFPEKQIGRIKADSGYVGQVLMNLVVNARDAMPNGGKITIATANATLDEDYARAHAGAVPGDYVMFSVSDTGTGMTDEVKAHMFEAFFTTKPKGKGTGLGLATCQTIVQQSGGHIAVHSELAKARPSRFISRGSSSRSMSPATTDQDGPMPRGTETLLVVEDEPAVRHLACQSFGSPGLQCAARPPTARMDCTWRAQSKAAPISLVITDVIMPQMGGKVMAEWLKTTLSRSQNPLHFGLHR